MPWDKFNAITPVSVQTYSVSSIHDTFSASAATTAEKGFLLIVDFPLKVDFQIRKINVHPQLDYTRRAGVALRSFCVNDA